MRRLSFVALLAALAGCGDSLTPAALDAAHDTCASCRMVVSDAHLASQIVTVGEEPRFFDDLGCLRAYLDAHPSAEGIVFVADHRTGEWTRASQAVFSRLARPSTPMASGFVAHATGASRDADPAAAQSQPVSASDVLGEAAGSMQP